MTQSVVFRTPDLIDLRAFTIFGINAKPNSDSPIGFFGTGLKYAIAVLLRTNPKRKITLWVGMQKYSFTQDEVDFRGKEFTTIKLHREKGLWRATTELSYTTELGKSWELWMAFRELEANTRDESGATFIIGAPEYIPLHRCSSIIVEGDDFVQCYHNRDTIFLPDALPKQTTVSGGVQVFPKPSNHVYYRGLRIRDLKKPSMYTYNILQEVQLTEDRTAKFDWEVDQVISKAVVQSDDEPLIKAVVKAVDTTYEGNLDYTNVYSSPGPTFLKVMQEERYRIPKHLPAARYAERYIATQEAEAEAKPLTPEAQIEELCQCIEKGRWEQARELIDHNRKHVIDVLMAGQYALENQPLDPHLLDDDKIPF